MSAASVSVPKDSVDEAGGVTAWLDTISFCNDFCDWVDNEWSIASLAAEPDTQQPVESPAAADTASAQPSPEESVETRPAGRRKSRIRAFFKSIWKAVKLPSRFCRRNPHHSNPAPQSNPRNSNPAPQSNTNNSNHAPQSNPHYSKPAPQSNPHHSNPASQSNPHHSNPTPQSNPHHSIPAPQSNPHHSNTTPQSNPCHSNPGPSPVAGPSGLQQMPNADPAVPEPSDCDPNTECLLTFYEVKNMLGFGSFGRVFKAVRKSDGQEVAIKNIRKRQADHHLFIPGCSRPLIIEVAMMQMLRRPPLCPYVIEMYEWFDRPQITSLVLEYPQPCIVLQGFIAAHHTLSEPMACHLMRQLVLAVQHCIDHSVFHNDIHEYNILVNTSSLELKLIDFGCAHLVNSDGYNSAQYMGGVEYCPPEVFKQPKYHTVPASVWKLGIVLYLMVHGRLPFFCMQAAADVRLVWKPDLSNACRDLISQCLNSNPAKRLTLEQILQHEWFRNQC